jgi:hypothetical protein
VSADRDCRDCVGANVAYSKLLAISERSISDCTGFWAFEWQVSLTKAPRASWVTFEWKKKDMATLRVGNLRVYP